MTGPRAPLAPHWPETPFAGGGERPRVSVAHGEDPYAITRAALARVDLTPARGRRVLLKPNAGRSAPSGSGIITEASVVAAAIDAFLEVGATVAVGDSPIAGVKKLQALEVSGIAEVARKRGVPVLEFDAGKPVPVALPGGVAIQRLELCGAVLEHDIVVSMPVMKCHMHTGVTLAVKNMKGCLWRRTKVDLHMLPPVEGYVEKSLDIAIADMSALLVPHLSIIDGTTGMEGLGPSAGRAKQLGVVVVGTDAWAADAVACRLMGRRAEEIPHLALGARRSLGTIELERIEVEPDGWESWASPFELPPTNLSIEFAGVKVLDEASCSACQSTLLLFLKRYGTELAEYLPDADPVYVAIGKGHDEVPAGTLCIGNCTREHRARGVYVSGCPPVGSAIQNTLIQARDRRRS